MTLSDLTKGDECWQINSAGNRVFLCTVLDVNHRDRTIRVRNEDKDVELVFNFDGAPSRPVLNRTGGVSRLVPKDDPVALKLEADAAVRQLRREVSDFIPMLPKAAALAGIRAALDQWEAN